MRSGWPSSTTMLEGKVIPNELPRQRDRDAVRKTGCQDREIFQTEELLPGDEVWFENPYFSTFGRRPLAYSGDTSGRKGITSFTSAAGR